MTDKEIIIDGVDVKECIFYIDHNPPEGSGTWGGAIHKGACKLNSTDCKDTDRCFIKNLYNKLKRKEQECHKYKQALDEITESLIPICDSCRKYYYNQCCEDCDTGYIKDIINEAKEQ